MSNKHAARLQTPEVTIEGDMAIKKLKVDLPLESSVEALAREAVRELRDWIRKNAKKLTSGKDVKLRLEAGFRETKSEFKSISYSPATQALFEDMHFANRHHEHTPGLYRSRRLSRPAKAFLLILIERKDSENPCLSAAEYNEKSGYKNHQTHVRHIRDFLAGLEEFWSVESVPQEGWKLVEKSKYVRPSRIFFD